VTSYGGWHQGHRQAQVYMGDEDSVDEVKMEDDGVVALGRGWWVKSRRMAKASSLAKVGHVSTSAV
jgi:hypothetical protein